MCGFYDEISKGVLWPFIRCRKSCLGQLTGTRKQVALPINPDSRISDSQSSALHERRPTT